MQRLLPIFFSVALAAALMASPVAALAAPPGDGNSEVENLKRRIEVLEAEQGTTAGPARSPLSLGSLADKITLNGLIELEAVYDKPEGSDESSDLALATVELGLDIQATDYLGGHILLLWEEGGSESSELDEAIIHLTYPLPLGGLIAGFTGGKMYVPFGKFNSYMISDPLTLDMGETNQSAGLVALGGKRWTLQAGAFSGETDTAGDSDTIDSWLAALDIQATKQLGFGVSLISDLAESDIGLVGDESLYRESVMGASIWLSWQIGQFSLDAEYITALDQFEVSLLDLSEDLTGRKPKAWNMELAWMPNDRWQVAGRFEQAEDFQDDVARYGGAISYGLFEHAVLAAEYLHSDAKGPEGNPVHTATVQLAFEF